MEKTPEHNKSGPEGTADEPGQARTEPTQRAAGLEEDHAGTRRTAGLDEDHARTRPAAGARGGSGTRRKVPWLWVAPIPIALLIGLLIGAQLPVGDRAPAPEAPAAAQQNPGQNASPPAQQAADLPDVARLDPKDPTALGDPNAPVVMVAYTDFQCPYCAKWTAGTLPELMGKYIDHGQLRIEWRDLDLFGSASLTAAHAAQAAAMQGSYVAFHVRMAEGGTIAKESAYSDKNLTATAEDLGLDGDKFLADMDSKKAKDAVKRNIDEAMSLGVMSTPVFLINQTPFVGAQPKENFVAAIDAELQKADGGKQ